MIASVIDCHGAATASAAKIREAGLSVSDRPLSRFVTASLKVDFMKPTPMGKELELRGKVTEIGERKVVVSITVSADNTVTAKGEVVMVQIPEKR
jgi:acyl-CoA thioesterase FadM